MYYTQLERAVKFAVKAHQGQKRKDGVDFICHPITVGMMLQQIGMKEKYIIIGFLHDIIEDTSYNYNDIKERFGDEIADAVRGLSEDKKIKDYKLRKAAFMAQIQNLEDNNLMYIECADKLHNLLYDYAKNPNIIADYSERRRWYYFEMQKIINQRCQGPLVARFNEMITFLKPLDEEEKKDQ